jgi:hypothetical protein
MDSFNKRQKELRRLERQRDKAAKRKEMRAGKAAKPQVSQVAMSQPKTLGRLTRQRISRPQIEAVFESPGRGTRADPVYGFRPDTELPRVSVRCSR